MDFDLRLLRHARALAEEGSFARASRALHLTQPALSRSIQELERRTGVKLFDRGPDGVEPTDLGRVFIAQARELLGRAEAMDREVALMRGSGTGSLVVGSGTFPTALFMPAAVAAFLRRNPRVGIRFVNDNWVTLLAALRRRELDLIVAAPPAVEDATGLIVQMLSPHQGYFLVRAGHPLLSKRVVSIGDVADCAIICSGRLPLALTEGLRNAREDGDKGRPIPDVSCESHEMMRRIATATDHVLLSALSANARAIEEGELEVLPLVDPRYSATFAIIRLQGRTLAPIADELVRDVMVADRETAKLERALASRLEGPRAPRSAAAGQPKRRQRAAVALSR
jgi:DNA-binding transcriptional LysR family regulator